MRFGTNPPRSLRDQRRPGSYRPRTERLEARELLTINSIDLADVAGTAAGGPYGVLESGQATLPSAGFSVTDVGDVNGDGFQDFVVGSPTSGTTPGQVGPGATARAYLIFGSNQVSNTTIDFLSLSSLQRIGDLNSLGNAVQTNPATGTATLSFNGVAFQTSLNSGSQLGASVAGVGDINGDGFADFLIGAPGANGDPSATTPTSSPSVAGAGRAYLIYGSANLATLPTKLYDLDTTTPTTAFNYITFVNNLPSASTGRGVGLAGDVIPDGVPDIAIGAPNALLNTARAGAVYVVSGTVVRDSTTRMIDLANVDNPTPLYGGASTAGVIFDGVLAGDQTGFSVAGAGDFSGTTIAGSIPENDFLIGAPQYNPQTGTVTGPGEAYLIYANAALPGDAVLTTAGSGQYAVPLASLGDPAVVGAKGVFGAVFLGDTQGEEAGFAVSTAGDFNGDGVDDILIGSPRYDTSTLTDAGRVDVIFGHLATTAEDRIFGVQSLTTLATNGSAGEFDGVDAGDLVGSSVTAMGNVNGDAFNEIAFGAPGYVGLSADGAASRGAVYMIAGSPFIVGQNPVNSTDLPELFITDSDPSFPVTSIGSGVSSLISLTSLNRTTDGDALADLIIGGLGGVYDVEGGLITLPLPTDTSITSPIKLGQPIGQTAISASTPADLVVYILSAGATPAGISFNPFADLDPTTIKVNGIALPDPTTFTQDIDEDGDGIPDAFFTFSPRSLLALPNGQDVITVSAITSATSPFPNRLYTGTITVGVTGGTTGNTGNNLGGVGSTRTTSFSDLGAGATSNLPFGEQLVPSETLLHKLNYKPVPRAIAHHEFLPKNGFGYRAYALTHPHAKAVGLKSAYSESSQKTFTLGNKVFTRGLKPGKFIVHPKKKK